MNWAKLGKLLKQNHPKMLDLIRYCVIFYIQLLLIQIWLTPFSCFAEFFESLFFDIIKSCWVNLFIMGRTPIPKIQGRALPSPIFNMMTGTFVRPLIITRIAIGFGHVCAVPRSSVMTFRSRQIVHHVSLLPIRLIRHTGHYINTISTIRTTLSLETHGTSSLPTKTNHHKTVWS